MTTNTENVEKITALIEALEGAIKAAGNTNARRAFYLHLARDAVLGAREAARHDETDLCGRKLETARAYIQEARA